MQLGVSARMEELRDRIRRFIRDEVFPLEHQYLNSGFREILPVLSAKRRRVQELGLWAPHLPEAYGGLGLPLAEFAHISEELGRSPIGHYLFNCQAPDVGNMELLIAHGTPEQQERFLLPLAHGAIRSCFSMTEPEFAGSNPVLLGTTAICEGDEYVINGHKWFTSSADGAAFAIVMVVTDPQAASPHQRASQIIVPTDTPGFNLVRNISIMGDPGEDYASHAEIRYENCRVPRSNLLGRAGAGFALAQERLGPGRIHHCMRWIGICERAFDLMCQRAATRELASGRLLGSRQTIQHWIAESRAEINASRLLVLDAAAKIDAVGVHAAREDVSLIKFFVARTLQRVLDRAIQVHGALGITDDTPLAYWYRHERGARIYDGPDEVHKAVVARRILQGYGVDVGM
ncbi:MAG: acyl-CoA dehydrogenase family protein [Herpetosiphonaceae bacterium]|nr:acyl-CoA dehydrogenase family protein [Herpetosiphonaceae bacterium]